MPSRYFEAKTSFVPERGLLAFSGFSKPFALEVAIMSLLVAAKRAKSQEQKIAKYLRLLKSHKASPSNASKASTGCDYTKEFFARIF